MIRPAMLSLTMFVLAVSMEGRAAAPPAGDAADFRSTPSRSAAGSANCWASTNRRGMPFMRRPSSGPSSEGCGSK